MNLIEIQDLQVGDNIGWLNISDEKKTQFKIGKLTTVVTSPLVEITLFDSHKVDPSLFLIIRPDNPYFQAFLYNTFGKENEYKHCQFLFLHKALVGNFARLNAPM